MKTILLTLSLCIFSTLSFSQIVAKVNTTTETKHNAISAEKMIALKKDHTEKAIQQLNEHFSKNLSYSRLMEEYLIEGKAIVEVQFSSDGSIQQASIIESNSKLLDKSIRKALTSFKAIKVKGKVYRGNKKFQFPIHFSIDK